MIRSVRHATIPQVPVRKAVKGRFSGVRKAEGDQWRVVWDYDPQPEDTLADIDGTGTPVISLPEDEQAAAYAKNPLYNDGKEVPLDEYLAGFGNPENHVVLYVRAEQKCAQCNSWTAMDSLYGIDFYTGEGGDSWDTGTYDESEIPKLSETMQEYSREVLDNAKAGGGHTKPHTPQKRRAVKARYPQRDASAEYQWENPHYWLLEQIDNAKVANDSMLLWEYANALAQSTSVSAIERIFGDAMAVAGYYNPITDGR
jgi:hypothetical protein